MDKNEWIALFHKEMRQDVVTPGFIREETDYIVRHISKFNESGFILASNVDENSAREVIRNERSYFGSLNQRFEWKVFSYDKPDNLTEILKQEGFTIDDPEALMVVKLSESHPFLTNFDLQIVKEITDEQGIQDLIALEEAIWKESYTELGERLWRDKQNSPDSLYIYGVYEDDQLVSAAWMYLENNSSFAGLWGGSTLPQYRGNGYYSKLLAVRAQKAYEKGYFFPTVDASPMSKPILEKAGFSCLAYSYGCQSPSISMVD